MVESANNRVKIQRGLTLVEVLVAITIFAIGGLMTLMMTTSSLHVTTDSRSVDSGVNLARIQMEYLLGLDYDHGQLQDTNANGTAGLLASTPATADYAAVNGRYLVAWNVADNVPVNGAKTLSVIVSWQGTSRPKKVVFQTIVAE